MVKILLVDDEEPIVRVVTHSLDAEGFETVAASDVESGWRAVVEHVPAAVVVDLRLPGPPGWDLIERLRRDGRFHNTVVVVLTGLLEEDVIARARSLGCTYLSKPFIASALVNRLRQALEERSRAPAAPPLPPVAAPTSEVQPRVELNQVPVMLLLDTCRVEGLIYLAPELGRFSEAWESMMRDHRTFLPVTDATVSRPDGGGATDMKFLVVRKTHIRAVWPLKDDRV